jgi:pyruvate formate lyase activating enzyme
MSLHEAMLYEKQKEGKVKCALCARRCLISDGATGFCLVRQNQGGTLYTLNYGKAVSAGVDPISKKPLSHFNPGALVMSVAAAGCNFRCQFCDNWMISQDHEVAGNPFPPEEVVKSARTLGAKESATLTLNPPSSWNTLTTARSWRMKQAYSTRSSVTGT